MTRVSTKSIVRKKLVENPYWRERANRVELNARFIEGEFHTGLDIPVLERLVNRCLGIDRAWRDITLNDKSLRGDDYGDKEVLEQEAQTELGYTPMHQQSIKKLETL